MKGFFQVSNETVAKRTVKDTMAFILPALKLEARRPCTNRHQIHGERTAKYQHTPNLFHNIFLKKYAWLAKDQNTP